MARYVHARLPWWLGAAAVVVMGRADMVRAFPHHIDNVEGVLWAALGVGRSVQLRYRRVRSCRDDLPCVRVVADFVVAFAPGAQDTMMVLALGPFISTLFLSARIIDALICRDLFVALTARRCCG